VALSKFHARFFVFYSYASGSSSVHANAHFLSVTTTYILQCNVAAKIPTFKGVSRSFV